jgi:hypothetical protein
MFTAASHVPSYSTPKQYGSSLPLCQVQTCRVVDPFESLMCAIECGRTRMRAYFVRVRDVWLIYCAVLRWMCVPGDQLNLATQSTGAEQEVRNRAILMEKTAKRHLPPPPTQTTLLQYSTSEQTIQSRSTLPPLPPRRDGYFCSLRFWVARHTHLLGRSPLSAVIEPCTFCVHTNPHTLRARANVQHMHVHSWVCVHHVQATKLDLSAHKRD